MIFCGVELTKIAVQASGMRPTGGFSLTLSVTESLPTIAFWISSRGSHLFWFIHDWAKHASLKDSDLKLTHNVYRWKFRNFITLTYWSDKCLSRMNDDVMTGKNLCHTHTDPPLTFYRFCMAYKSEYCAGISWPQNCSLVGSITPWRGQAGISS